MSSLFLHPSFPPNRHRIPNKTKQLVPSIPNLRLGARTCPFPPLFNRAEMQESDSMPGSSDVGSPIVSTEAEAEAEAESEPNLMLPLMVNEEDVNGGVVLGLGTTALQWAILISPFFFWGTAMVVMKEIIPKAGPFFVSTVRLVPAGMILIGFSSFRGSKQPSGLLAWVSITLFGIINAACFQGFLAEGLQTTTAGLGSVIIDSQPLTVAVLAAILFGESIGLVGAAGLVLGVFGLLLLEVPAIMNHEGGDTSIWGSGEWWMLLSAQSMAVGTVMIRWVSKYSDPVMATGWHMIIGGIPLLAISFFNHEPAVTGSLSVLTAIDFAGLLYTTVFGSAISYSVFFYNATKGNLTKLSSLTFLTPMFASFFGYLFLGETFSPLQLGGAFVTLVAIYMVNYREIFPED